MIPENILEWILSKFNFLPFPVADTFIAMFQARAVLAGARLGVFDHLAKTPSSSEELAIALSCQHKGIKTLLEALECSRYVTEKNGKYALSRQAKKWMDPDMPFSMNRFIDFNNDNWDWISQLESSVKTGAIIDLHDNLLDSEGWRRYLFGLHDLSRMAAKEILFRFKIKGSGKRLLDIGGGHGAYAAAFCRNDATLKATLFDLPPAIEVGKEVIEKYYSDVSGQIDFVSGSLLKEDLGSGYDVVFLFNVLHHINNSEIEAVFKKIHGAMNPGGTFVILDQFKQTSRKDSYGAALTQLLFLVTSNAGSNRLDDVKSHLKSSGFSAFRFKGLKVGPGTALLTATRQ